MEIQHRFKEQGITPKTTWGKPQYNMIKGDSQRIETSRGCPNQCPYCYEPEKLEVFPIPEIKRHKVEILDMNFLYQPNILNRIKSLPDKLDGKVIRYEEICGFDYRLMTHKIAHALKEKRFVNIRLAWDGFFKDQYKIKDAFDMLVTAGYKRGKDLSAFMIVNYKVPRVECEKKLDLLKVWRVKVCDCCYNGGYKIAVPEYWTQKEITAFRRRCRKHNHIVRFGIDPEV